MPPRNDGKPGRKAANATTFLRRIAGNSASLRRHIERERVNAAVARQIYEARTARGLSQKALANLVGTTQSVIARLEDADYEGHSLSTLRRIAAVLDREVQVRFVPIRGKRAA